jgi:uncharacterized membrane protein YeiH
MVIYSLDLIGTVAFAISGALSAADKKFDWFGATFAAFVTAVGGGSLRDLFIGNLPVTWLSDINYLFAILTGVIITYLYKSKVMKWKKTLSLFDTIGLGVFTIIGTEKALMLGINPVMAGIMGMFSAVLGGVIRDTLCNDIPLIFKQEIYATACLIGALFYLVLNHFSVAESIIVPASVVLIIIIRLLSVRFNLSLPQFR